jgi:hypothetical protein
MDGVFLPDYVAAAVPLSVSKCTMTSYGVRLKPFMRGMEVYPDVVSTVCEPPVGQDGAATGGPSPH